MASATAHVQVDESRLADSSPARLFHWLVSILVVAGFAALFARSSGGLDSPELAAWIVASLIADLMYVRIGQSVTLSMSLPVLLAAAYAHEPIVTGLIAFLGCLDPRELQGKSSIERIFFNRAQISLAAAAASLVMHSVSRSNASFPAVLIVFAFGLLADSAINVALVVVSTVLSRRARWRQAISGLWGVEPSASVGLYVSMCFVAPVFFLIYREWGPWALLTCTAVLLPFRVALTRIESLGMTSGTLRVREAALADAEKSAQDQRLEERLFLAGDLHDEVLPALFRVHLMGEVVRQDLASGRLLELDEDVPELLDATNAAQQSVRKVVGDLRTARAAIRNVPRAIRHCADQLDREGSPRIDLRLAEIWSSERQGFVLFQVAREAMTNASRYSDADRISVQLEERPSGWAVLQISDDGIGFDPAAVDRESHFGLQLMRERVEAAGGRVDVSTAEGVGTVVTATLPLNIASDQPQI
jgi:signal transduction histidine kinase